MDAAPASTTPSRTVSFPTYPPPPAPKPPPHNADDSSTDGAEDTEGPVAALSSDLRLLEIASADPYERAAEAILSSDLFLIGAGAGFSADSGLAVYKDIANVPAWRAMGTSYPALCSPSWLPLNPEIFYGFHGTCFNNYRDKNPHEGYTILKEWKKRFFSHSKYNRAFASSGEAAEPWGSPLFVYTSNVDAHFEKAGFPVNHIHAIHGEQDWWQCSDGGCAQPVVRPPAPFRFHVDNQTMLAGKENPQLEKVDEASRAELKKLGFAGNYPRCPTCNDFLRPNILMFGDMEWRSRSRDTGHVWYRWSRTVSDLLKTNPAARLTILEVGCGLRIPTIRSNCSRLAAELPAAQVRYIRINPDEPTSYDVAGAILLQAKALPALTRIHETILRKTATP